MLYWVFLIIFIITVLVPDIIRTDVSLLSETRAEEILIFLLGAVAFIVFMKNEQQLLFHKKEKEKDQKKIEQTVKDLVESYSYIGEVNRKMDILMNIALGLSDRTALSKAHEDETYASIASAACSLLKADAVALRFVNVATAQTEKEFQSEENAIKMVKNGELTKMEENINIKKYQDCLIISSSQEIKNTKGYIIVCGFDEEEESNPKNVEILKVFASQALFLYSYTRNPAPAEVPAR